MVGPNNYFNNYCGSCGSKEKEGTAYNFMCKWPSPERGGQHHIGSKWVYFWKMKWAGMIFKSIGHTGEWFYCRVYCEGFFTWLLRNVKCEMFKVSMSFLVVYFTLRFTDMIDADHWRLWNSNGLQSLITCLPESYVFSVNGLFFYDYFLFS